MLNFLLSSNDTRSSRMLLRMLLLLLSMHHHLLMLRLMSVGVRVWVSRVRHDSFSRHTNTMSVSTHGRHARTSISLLVIHHPRLASCHVLHHRVPGVLWVSGRHAVSSLVSSRGSIP